MGFFQYYSYGLNVIGFPLKQHRWPCDADDERELNLAILGIPDSQIKYISFCFGQFRYIPAPLVIQQLQLLYATAGNKSKCQSRFVLKAHSQRSSTRKKINRIYAKNVISVCALPGFVSFVEMDTVRCTKNGYEKKL